MGDVPFADGVPVIGSTDELTADVIFEWGDGASKEGNAVIEEADRGDAGLELVKGVTSGEEIVTLMSLTGIAGVGILTVFGISCDGRGRGVGERERDWEWEGVRKKGWDNCEVSEFVRRGFVIGERRASGGRNVSVWSWCCVVVRGLLG